MSVSRVSLNFGLFNQHHVDIMTVSPRPPAGVRSSCSSARSSLYRQPIDRSGVQHQPSVESEMQTDSTMGAAAPPPRRKSAHFAERPSSACPSPTGAEGPADSCRPFSASASVRKPAAKAASAEMSALEEQCQREVVLRGVAVSSVSSQPVLVTSTPRLGAKCRSARCSRLQRERV